LEFSELDDNKNKCLTKILLWIPARQPTPWLHHQRCAVRIPYFYFFTMCK